MRKIMAAFAVASFMALGACANVSPLQAVTEAVCKDGVSVADFLKQEQTKFPAYNVHIENVVEGEVVATLLAGSNIKADKVVVLGAVLDGQPSSGVKLLAVDGGCVVGVKTIERDTAVTQGFLPEQAS